MNENSQIHHKKTKIQNFFSQGDLLTLGFGTTAAMWAVGFLCRLPFVMVPVFWLVFLMFFCLFAGGFIAGCTTRYGWLSGIYTGLIVSVLNLLILGSLISNKNNPNQIVPSALWWIPGSFFAGAAIGCLGSGLSNLLSIPQRKEINWTAVLAKVAVTVTFFLLMIGGMVTGYGAGLSVVDWPNSFGYNMFLYPLSRMSGGIYYEHSHRLFGSLVGLTTLVLAFHIRQSQEPTWIKRLGLICIGLVIIQGILGGLRVTGHFTLSTSPTDTTPSILLAMVHGVVGQVFFATLIALALFVSNSWKNTGAPFFTSGATTARTLSKMLVGLVIIQLIAGAILRHITGGLHLHITLAFIVAAVGIACGVRAWGLYSNIYPLKKLGLTLTYLIATQLFLGFGALVVTGLTKAVNVAPSALSVLITTTHQSVGAIILAVSVLMMLWSHHLLVQKTD